MVILSVGLNQNNPFWDQLNDIIDECDCCFVDELSSDDGYSWFDFHIRTSTSQPVWDQLDLSDDQNDLLGQKVSELLRSGHLVRSNSQWSSPAFPKYINNKLELCVDYSELNGITYGANYQVPTCRDLLNSICYSKFFSVIVIKDGFHQLHISEDSRHKTAFQTDFGTFEFTTFHHGLKNAQSNLQFAVDKTLQNVDQNSIKIYLGRILIHTPDIPSHLDVLEHVLRCMKNSNFKIDTDESHFVRRSVSYLGMYLDSRGISIDKRKLDAFDRPSNKSQLRSILGLAGQYKHYVSNYNNIIRPLSQLTSPNVQFRWSMNEERAFENLKAQLYSSDPIPFSHYNNGF